MRRIVLVYLLLSNSAVANLLPFKYTSGDMVVFEISDSGRLLTDNSKTFCQMFSNPDTVLMDAFLSKYPKASKNASIEATCSSSLNTAISSYRSLGMGACIVNENNKSYKKFEKICQGDKKRALNNIKYMSFFNEQKLLVETRKATEYQKMVVDNNHHLLTLLEGEKKVAAQECDKMKARVFKNDNLGIKTIRNLVNSETITSELAKKAEQFTFLIDTSPKYCLELKEFSDLKDETIEVRGLLKTFIQTNKLKPKEKVNTTPESRSVLSESDYTNQMASYATIIGRATACGIDPTKKINDVGRWMDEWFNQLNISQKQRATYLTIFMKGTEYHMNEQLNGNSPDSCTSVKRVYNSI